MKNQKLKYIYMIFMVIVLVQILILIIQKFNLLIFILNKNNQRVNYTKDVNNIRYSRLIQNKIF